MTTRRWSVSTTDQLFGAAAYAPLIVATDKGPVSSAAADTGLPASSASAVASVNTVAGTAAATAAASTAISGCARRGAWHGADPGCGEGHRQR